MEIQPDVGSAPPRGPPAQRIDSAGAAHVDYRAVLALALPLIANSAVQVVLNLTDVWFVGHISTNALAAVGRGRARLSACHRRARRPHARSVRCNGWSSSS